MLDAHCHLQFQQFDEDRDDVLTRAVDHGVRGIILADYDSDRRSAAVDLARRDGIWTTVGLHPWACEGLDESALVSELGALEDAARQSSAVAVGELGLDRAREEAMPLDDQRRVMRAQLGLARDLELPVVIHSVRANDEVAAVLRGDGLPAAGGIVHGFRGSTEQARRFVALGLKLSVGSAILGPGHEKLARVVTDVGLDAIVVETDAPSGARGRRAEPADLRLIVEAVANTLRADPAEVAEITEKNARRLFALGDETLSQELR